MATTQTQVDKALEELATVRRNKDGSANGNAAWGIAKRYKAAPHWNTYEDTEYSRAIYEAVVKAVR